MKVLGVTLLSLFAVLPNIPLATGLSPQSLVKSGNPLLSSEGSLSDKASIYTIGHIFAAVQDRSDAKSLNLPSEYGDPVVVYAGFHIESMGNMKATDMAFDMDIFLRLSWNDYRQKHNDSIKLLNEPKDIEGMWLPDIYFANARTAEFQMVTVPNFAVFVDQDGTIAYSARVVLKTACNLNLRAYPLDKQKCGVKLASYAHTRPQMDVRWFSSDPIEMNPAINLPEYRIVSVKPEKCNGTFTYAITERERRVANFSCLEGAIRLKREIGYHLVQTYIPTGLIVIISWVSFWIDVNAVPARVTLSFTSLLTLATQGAGLRYSLPPVSYAKAIDWWFGACMIFVFAALLEFTIVNTFMRMSKKMQTLGSYNPKTKKFKHDQEAVTALESVLLARNMKHEEAEGMSESIFLVKSKNYATQAVKTDQISRFLFPLIFSLFNIFYWVVFTDS